MLNRKFTPEEIAEIHEVMPHLVGYEIIDDSMVWVKHFEENHDISGQLFIMESGQIIAHTVSAAEIYAATDIADGLAYLADIVIVG